MILSSPWWLWLAVLALVPWIGPLKGSKSFQNVLRSATFIALAFALSRPQLLVSDSTTHRVYVLDQSSSVNNEALGKAIVKLEQMDKSDLKHLVVIGGESGGERSPGFESVSFVMPDD